MALEIRFQGRTLNKTDGGTETNIVRVGTSEEVLEGFNRLHISTRYAGLGRLITAVVKQESPKIWVLEEKYLEQTDGINIVTPPDDVYGKKTATLGTGNISMPLEKRPGYLAQWNHYLAGAKDTTLPGWAAGAKDTTLSGDQAQNFRWIKEPGELPQGWALLSSPTKPGVSGYDLATYTVTEKVKCRSARAAGKEVCSKINRIGEPTETFGISGGNWKCDDAQVQWDGKAWCAVLTWTRSGDDAGWDKDLYD